MLLHSIAAGIRNLHHVPVAKLTCSSLPVADHNLYIVTVIGLQWVAPQHLMNEADQQAQMQEVVASQILEMLPDRGICNVACTVSPGDNYAIAKIVVLTWSEHHVPGEHLTGDLFVAFAHVAPGIHLEWALQDAVAFKHVNVYYPYITNDGCVDHFAAIAQVMQFDIEI